VAQGSETRTVSLAFTAVAAASVLAGFVLSACYAALRIWFHGLFPSWSPTTSGAIAFGLIILAVTSGIFLLYWRMPRLAPEDRQRIIDRYTAVTLSVLFCTFMTAVAASLFSAKYGFLILNDAIGSEVFDSKEMLFAPFLMMNFYWGIMILLLPTVLHRRLGGNSDQPQGSPPSG